MHAASPAQLAWHACHEAIGPLSGTDGPGHSANTAFVSFCTGCHAGAVPFVTLKGSQASGGSGAAPLMVGASPAYAENVRKESAGVSATVAPT